MRQRKKAHKKKIKQHSLLRKNPVEKSDEKQRLIEICSRRRRRRRIPIHCQGQWQHLGSYFSCLDYSHKTHKFFWTWIASFHSQPPWISESLIWLVLLGKQMKRSFVFQKEKRNEIVVVLCLYASPTTLKQSVCVCTEQ